MSAIHHGPCKMAYAKIKKDKISLMTPSNAPTFFFMILILTQKCADPQGKDMTPLRCGHDLDQPAILKGYKWDMV